LWLLADRVVKLGLSRRCSYEIIPPGGKKNRADVVKPWQERQWCVPPVGEAHRRLRQLKFHYTPKDESWLNIAEIELSVLTREYLQSAHPGTRGAHRRTRRVQAAVQPRGGIDPLAVHQRESVREAPPPLPIKSLVTEH